MINSAALLPTRQPSEYLLMEIFKQGGEKQEWRFRESGSDSIKRLSSDLHLQPLKIDGREQNMQNNIASVVLARSRLHGLRSDTNQIDFLTKSSGDRQVPPW